MNPLARIPRLSRAAITFAVGLAGWMAIGVCSARAATPASKPATPAASTNVIQPAYGLQWPASFGDGLVLRRAIGSDDKTGFTVTTVGLENLDARTRSTGRHSGPSVRVDPVTDEKADPCTWRVVFPSLRPQDPFHLDFTARIRRSIPVKDRSFTRTLSNVAVGEVWLWELGHGDSLPVPDDQRAAVLRTFTNEAVLVRLLDVRSGSARAPAAPRAAEPPAPVWQEVTPESLTAGGYPNFLPVFVQKLAEGVRATRNDIPGERGRPLAVGLILVDPDKVPAGGRSGDLRQEKGRIAIDDVNQAVWSVRNSYGGLPRAVLSNLKREGRLPPPEPLPDLLDRTVISGPFKEFTYEDASGMIRLQRSASGP